MPTRLVGFGLFILFFLLAVAALWPAAALVPWVDSASNGRWQLSAAEGSLWNGKGVLLSSPGNGAAKNNAQNIRWQLRWGELIHGRIGVDTALEQGSLFIAAEPDGLTIERLDTTLPAPVFLSLLPGALGRYGWAGKLHARSSAFHCAWKGGACVGEIELQWNDASVAEVPGNKLGDYRLRMVGEGKALRFDLTTLRGRLQIAGSGELAGNGISFNGEVAATGADAASLDALLRTLGRPAATPGKYLLEYREMNASR